MRATSMTALAVGILMGAAGAQDEAGDAPAPTELPQDEMSGAPSAQTDDAREATATGHPNPEFRRTYLQDLVERQTLTGHWFGKGDELEDLGITLTLNMWVVYQANVNGGVRTDDGTTGEYRLAGYFDLDRLVGVEGGGVFLRVDGGWEDGIADDVGSLSSIDGEFSTDDPIVVTQLWYQQDLLDQLSRAIGSARACHLASTAGAAAVDREHVPPAGAASLNEPSAT